MWSVVQVTSPVRLQATGSIQQSRGREAGVADIDGRALGDVSRCGDDDLDLVAGLVARASQTAPQRLFVRESARPGVRAPTAVAGNEHHAVPWESLEPNPIESRPRVRPRPADHDPDAHLPLARAAGWRQRLGPSRGQATEVGSLSQKSLPERRERGCSVGTSLRGVVAAAECVEQVGAVGGHQ